MSSWCGPDPISWFSANTWPACACGYSPRANDSLIEHWRQAGFRVVAENGALIKYPVDE